MWTKWTGTIWSMSLAISNQNNLNGSLSKIDPTSPSTQTVSYLGWKRTNQMKPSRQKQFRDSLHAPTRTWFQAPPYLDRRLGICDKWADSIILESLTRWSDPYTTILETKGIIIALTAQYGSEKITVSNNLLLGKTYSNVRPTPKWRCTRWRRCRSSELIKAGSSVVLHLHWRYIVGDGDGTTRWSWRRYIRRGCGLEAQGSSFVRPRGAIRDAAPIASKWVEVREVHNSQTHLSILEKINEITPQRELCGVKENKLNEA